MYQSQLFTKTRKEAPKDEVTKNAELLLRGGFVYKEMAGVYAFLPLGLSVLKNIEKIIREEMEALGGQEVSLTALQDKTAWEKTNRWDDEILNIWFKTKLKNDTEVGLATTHEEPLTLIMKEYVNSYRDLPRYVYQFQTKFRNELRSKSGILRGREFLMKDLYSFSRNEEEHEDFYEKAKTAYQNIFEKCGLGAITYVTFASGGSFSEYSHEFQTLTAAGEDTIFLDEKKGIAINKEIYNDEVIKQLGLDKNTLVEKKATEVGNIFSLGTKFSDSLKLTYKDEEGKENLVIMGSYGIGLGRVMGTVVEVFSDERGIVWPESISPFQAHLIEISNGADNVRAWAGQIYKKLRETKEVLYDDRDIRAGEKFADADLIGIPYQIIVSERGLKDKVLEIKERRSGKSVLVKEADFLKKDLKDFLNNND